MEKNQINNLTIRVSSSIGIPTSFSNFFLSVAPNIQSHVKKTFKPFHYYITN